MAYEDRTKQYIETLIDNKDWTAAHNALMAYIKEYGKVGLDCANGSSWNIAKSVFDALGADT